MAHTPKSPRWTARPTAPFPDAPISRRCLECVAHVTPGQTRCGATAARRAEICIPVQCKRWCRPTATSCCHRSPPPHQTPHLYHRSASPSGPTLADCGADLAEAGRILSRFAKFGGPSLVECGHYRANFGRSQANFDRNRATSVRFRTTLEFSRFRAILRHFRGK